MLRLGKSFACALVAVAALMMPAVAKSQATAPSTPGQMTPQMNPAFSRPHPNQPTPAPNMMTAPGGTVAPPQMPASVVQTSKPHARRSKATQVAEETPATPPPPPTLEQSAPVAPQVTLQNGQLTINASNSTMAQVLHAVQARTGASIEIPSSANNERVVAQIGPGIPRDVLNTLLNGSKFNYVILGVTGDPGGIQKVILTPRQGGGGSAPAVNTAQNNSPQPVQEDDVVDESVPVADTSDNEYQNPDQPPPPPGGFRRPMMPGGQQFDPGAQNNGGEQQNGPKTPEQLMQEMQQLQQQQMMYNQQLNPANQQPNQ